jgi:hypothetical protein
MENVGRPGGPGRYFPARAGQVPTGLGRQNLIHLTGSAVRIWPGQAGRTDTVLRWPGSKWAGPAKLQIHLTRSADGILEAILVYETLDYEMQMRVVLCHMNVVRGASSRDTVTRRI